MPEKTAAQTIAALRRRLERWELDHLRKLAVELEERLERAEADAASGWIAADQWREEALTLTRELMDSGETVGLTKQGHLVVMVGDENDNPLIERRGQPIEGTPS